MPKAQSFEALLERGDRRLGWTIARIPFDAGKTWGTYGLLKVKGSINGFPFRTSLFPEGAGRHILLVNKRMQAGARAALGDRARFRLELDTDERTVTPPVELAAALSEDPALRRWYDQLNYSIRKEIANWITDVKSAEARRRRADQIAERLLATMDAERELPPFIRVALARDGRAAEGWKRMSPLRRRRILFAIFYYRDPLARDRRLRRALEEAREISERPAKIRRAPE
ncbi:MAG TPA: YdeI/OmpD-associated family protein [Bryobacteraceae bacterium]|nr:YdeI/OmpD-associated family protein [Bryobacteraceae bacterium]